MTQQHAKSRFLFRFGRVLHHWAAAFGVDPIRFFHSAWSLPAVLRQYFRLREQNAQLATPWNLQFSSPCLGEDRLGSGQASGHYFHQDLLVANRVFQRNPSRHVDVGSRIDGFVAHVAAFREVEVFDIRPQINAVKNIRFVQADMMKGMDGYESYCDSLSSLHALEHFGLGRYGDDVDIEGYRAGIHVFHKLLRQNGILYLSVPVGVQRIDFNSQRIFSIRTILDITTDLFDLSAFSYVDDGGNLWMDIALTPDAIADSLGLWYGCGIFEFRRN